MFNSSSGRLGQWKREFVLLVITGCVIVIWTAYMTQPPYSRDDGQTRKKVVRSDKAIEMRRRRQLVSERCKSANLSLPRNAETRDRFLVYKSGRLAMCYVPKAGCTFWKRVFLELQNRKSLLNTKNSSAGHTNLFKDKKWAIHYRHIGTLKDFHTFDTAYDFLKSAEKLLFVRDPYSRLFSGYVDKFILPDFWMTLGKQIVSNHRNNAEPLSLLCGYDVTFLEFLREALKAAKADTVTGADEHWFPIYKLCRPCTFDYDIIGKQESFNSDREYIMAASRISDILSPSISDEDLARNSMSQSSILSENKMKILPFPCRNSTFIIQTLWKAFKIQGYIRGNSSFPLRNVNNVSLSEFQTIAISTYNHNKPSRKEWNRRRRKSMVTAYKSISNIMMEDIRKTFKFDFLLFDYELKPEDLYRNRI